MFCWTRLRHQVTVLSFFFFRNSFFGNVLSMLEYSSSATLLSASIFDILKNKKNNVIVQYSHLSNKELLACIYWGNHGHNHTKYATKQGLQRKPQTPHQYRDHEKSPQLLVSGGSHHWAPFLGWWHLYLLKKSKRANSPHNGLPNFTDCAHKLHDSLVR